MIKAARWTNGQNTNKLLINKLFKNKIIYLKKKFNFYIKIFVQISRHNKLLIFQAF